MIGDKSLDVEFGLNAGVKPILVLTGYGQKDVYALKRPPEFVAENLLEAVKIVLEN
jgi:D-glycero-D-manno-heptose 1,7-bisphosphate phosphatase